MNLRRLRFWLGLLVLTGAERLCLAETTNCEIAVTAGPHDRKQALVRVSLPNVKGPVTSVRLTDSAGDVLPAQVTSASDLAGSNPELHFILPQLSAGQSVMLTASLSSEPPANETERFTWKDQRGDHTDLFLGKLPVLMYYYHPHDRTSELSRVRTYKVFHNLFSPRGDRVVTNGLPPDDPSTIHSPHHRGLFFGYNRISYGEGKKADLWHCPNGFQEHDRFLTVEAGPVLARHSMVVRWHGEDQQPFAEELRELTAFNVPGGRLFEFASRLKSLSGKVRLDGDRHHAGFQFRAHNDVDVKTTQETIYVRPDGVGKPGETRNWDPATGQGPRDLSWNAMSFVLDSQRYTAAYLDHPNNPRGALFSEREFGRFGSFFPATITEDRPLNIRYRIWLQDGLITPNQVAALSADFTEPVEVKVTIKK